MTRAGDLKSRLTFSSRGTGVADADGNVETAFADRFTVNARIRSRLGGEEIIAARLQGRHLATITVWRSPDTVQITTDWLATDVDTNEIWNVKSPAIDPDGKGQWLEMICERGPEGVAS